MPSAASRCTMGGCDQPATMRIHFPSDHQAAYCRTHGEEVVAASRRSNGLVFTIEPLALPEGQRGRLGTLHRLSDALALIESRGPHYALKCSPGDHSTFTPGDLRTTQPDELLLSETELAWYERPVAEIVGHLTVRATAHHDGPSYVIVDTRHGRGRTSDPRSRLARPSHRPHTGHTPPDQTFPQDYLGETSVQ